MGHGKEGEHAATCLCAGEERAAVRGETCCLLRRSWGGRGTLVGHQRNSELHACSPPLYRASTSSPAAASLYFGALSAVTSPAPLASCPQALRMREQLAAGKAQRQAHVASLAAGYQAVAGSVKLVGRGGSRGAGMRGGGGAGQCQAGGERGQQG